MKVFYFSTVVLFFISSIIVNKLVDGEQLNVDRWSAIDYSIRALFNGVYPYSIPDHIGNYSSNLPSLIFIGVPFYLLGDVGYIQSFTFLFFAYFLFKVFNNYKLRVLGILLLICSPLYLWEIYVKSELLSNFIWVLGFCVLWNKKYPNHNFDKPVLLGIFISFLFLTRIPALIPLTFFFFKGFIKTSLEKKIYFLISGLIVFIVSIVIVIQNCPSFEVLKQFNPLIKQGNKSPILISLIALLLPFYLAIIIRKKDVIRYTILFLGFPIFISFLIALYKYGFNNIIFNSAFGISYFNIIVPFLLYHIITLYKDKLIGEI